MSTSPRRPTSLRQQRPAPRAVVILLTLLALLAAACGSDDKASTQEGSPVPDASKGEFDVSRWDTVLAAAKGQTVNWYMYGGDDKINSFVNGYVKDELAKLGVTLNQVKINDTVEAVNKVLGEKQAGRTDDGGSVDMIWINGENFKTGRQADLWYCGYVKSLPNAEFVDFDDAAVTSDFGLPVDECETPWARAQSVVVYDSSKVAAGDVGSVDALLAYAKAHPGAFGYPAPPDFTGSMVVRTLFITQAGGYEKVAGPFDQAKYDGLAPTLWATLNDLEPALWRGDSYAQKQADVTTAFGQGELSIYLTYGSGGVAINVEKGVFPATTREAVFDTGNLGNISFTAIPKNSAHKAAALVLADLLTSPGAQYESQVTDGLYPAIDVSRTPDAAKFAAIPTPASQLPFADQVKNSVAEIQADWVTALEKDWQANVQQK
jgi:putative spermidine/putrescine transport system substrate-binding protein